MDIKWHKGLLSKEECKSIIGSFQNCERYQMMPGDHRLWGAERFLEQDVVAKIMDVDREYAIERHGVPPKFQTLMVNFTFQSEESQGSGQGWHRDSVLKYQQKTIVYLVDVSEENGPFILKDLRYIWLSRILIPVRRISDRIMLLCSFLFKENAVTCGAGSGFSTCTNFIHRGKPLIKGERYAVTVYSFFDHIPLHLKKLING
jgi:hypothetical protein